jgi:hypothetical protein
MVQTTQRRDTSLTGHPFARWGSISDVHEEESGERLLLINFPKEPAAGAGRSHMVCRNRVARYGHVGATAGRSKQPRPSLHVKDFFQWNTDR